MCRTKNLTREEREAVLMLGKNGHPTTDGTAAKPLGKSLASILQVPENLSGNNSIFKNHILIEIPKQKYFKTDYEGAMYDIECFEKMTEQFLSGIKTANILTPYELSGLKETLHDFIEDVLKDHAFELIEEETELTEEDYREIEADLIIHDPAAHYSTLTKEVYYD